MIDKVIGHYRIVEEIGKGGMGVVYKAYDLQLERYVAVKFLNQDVIGQQRFVERFKTEAKNQAKLMHQNIVTVYGFIEEKDLLGIVMEFVEGESLDRIIYRQRRLHLYDALFFLKQILHGLGHAHHKGFIHRDIKPSNIIITPDGTAKIMDFGISKSLYEAGQTQTGVRIGTTMYMSPEQIKGKELTAAADIYSLGATFYEMITGEPPFYFENEYDVMEAHIHKEISTLSERIPSVPTIVDELIGKSLNKKAVERYQNCDQFYKAADRVDIFLAKMQNDYIQRKIKREKTSKTRSIILFSLFFVVIGVLTVFTFQQVDALLKSRQVDNMREYSVLSLFQEELDFESLKKINLNTTSNLNSVKFMDEKNGYVVGNNGFFSYSDDGGTTWKNTIIDSTVNLYDAFRLNSGKMFVVGDSSSFYYRETKDTVWTRLDLEGNYSLFKIKFINDDLGFVLGSKGLLLRTDDGGINWIKCESGVNNILYDISFINSSKGYIVGWDGTALITNDAGINWEKIKPFTMKYLKSVDFADDLVGIAVGAGGNLYRTYDGGETWNLLMVKLNSPLNFIKFFNQSMCLVIGNKGTILYSKDWGKEFHVVKSNTFLNLNSFEVTPKGTIFICGINGTLIKI